MVTTAIPSASQTSLTRFYFLRAGVAAAWVAAAVTIGTSDAVAGAALLVLYPAWDAAANALDARANGGFKANASQTLNIVVSTVVALGVAVALWADMRLVLGLFGGWAVFAGLLQLATGVRRWRAYGAQWPMVVSGAQSALAGLFFVHQSAGAASAIATVAPYAGFGAFYFLVSAVALTLKQRRAAAERIAS